MLFANRNDFRAWLSENAEKREGVWLAFGKTKAVATLTANEALEEALCFGWIDGQMQSVDNTKYLKYFAPRRLKSVWSDKNKKTVEVLREKGLMTPPGEKAVEIAKKNGSWDAAVISDGQRKAFEDKLTEDPSAYEKYMSVSPSIRLAHLRFYLSVKSDELKERNLKQIIENLRNDWKPTM